MKFLKKIFFTLFILISGAIMITAFNFLVFVYAPSPATSPVYLEIPMATNFNKIVTLLKQKNLISNALFFQIFVRYKKVTTCILSGEYLIPPGRTPMELLNILMQGRVILHRITFPEGMTVKEIANLLEKKSICSSYRFYNLAMKPHKIACLSEVFPNLEGVLFPDTYLFPKNYPPKLVIKKMLDHFCEVYTYVLRKPAKNTELTNRDVITLASIIEKEALLKREMPVISSVFHNRLRKGMRLQSDPTVIYDIPYFVGKITKKDLLNPTPHNTYRFKGLPPDPICNPGESAIRAALNPANTNYLYFVARNDGTHVFSDNLNTHNIAVLLYQR
jgi:UPF0755 protein